MTLSRKNMNEKYKPEYVASKIPLDQHEYKGWFWYMPEKKFYRWNDLPHRKDAIINERNA
jgi:hypothetical protein